MNGKNLSQKKKTEEKFQTLWKFNKKGKKS